MVRRRLDVEIVRRGLAPSRAQAAAAVAAGDVRVGGSVAATAARQVAPDEPIAITGPGPRYVSRAGEKLAGALERFDVVVAGRRVLDAGAATGGFTQCLLEQGAERVYAVDVGRGQLAWTLRNDPRVELHERTNLRDLEPETLGGPVPLAVADLSFISLLTVAPALVRCTTADADLVLLVKPQFEAGRGRVGKGGIVRDPEVHVEVLTRVAAGLGDAGLFTADAVASTLPGADGNQEFLFHCRRSVATLRRSDQDLAALARAGLEASPRAPS